MDLLSWMFLWMFVLCLNCTAAATESFQFQTGPYTNDSDDKFYAGDCDRPSVRRTDLALHLISAQVKPYPVQLGTWLLLNITFNLSRTVGNERIEAELSIRLITPESPTEVCSLVPENICHYNDLCQKLQSTALSCPIEKGLRSFPNILIPIQKLPFELRGSFEVTMKLKEQAAPVGCIELHFCIGVCRPWEHLP